MMGGDERTVGLADVASRGAGSDIPRIREVPMVGVGSEWNVR